MKKLMFLGLLLTLSLFSFAQNQQQGGQQQAEIKPDSLVYNYEIVTKSDSLIFIKVKEYKETSVPTSSQLINQQVAQLREQKKQLLQNIEALDLQIAELSKYKGKVEDVEKKIEKIIKKDKN
jgi:hypothetical protein